LELTSGLQLIHHIKRNNMEIQENMIVGYVLDTYPETLDIFLKFGFTPLKDPVLRKTMPYKLTIEQACKMHNIDIDNLIRSLNNVIGDTKP